MDLSNKLEAEFVVACHKFAVDLCEALNSKHIGNLFFSPISIQLALVLTCIGAKDKTEQELLDALHFPDDKTKWLDYIKLLTSFMARSDTLKVATALFIEQSFRLKEEYVDVAKRYLNAQLQSLDFKSSFESTESSRKKINSWVLEKTNNKIDNILQPGSITVNTRAVLVNAIHFKNEWKYGFKKSDTRSKPFYLSKNKSVAVPIMFLKNRFLYTGNYSYQALEMPYKDAEFRMLILLPKEIDGLDALGKQLPDINLMELMSSMRFETVEVYFPKFKLEQCFGLIEVLMKLGINSMFDEEVSDFSSMYTEGQWPLVVSDVIHKSYLDVNEEGTEAAAATVVVMNMCFGSSAPRPPKPVVFNANHPFILYILKNDVIIFMGKIVNIS